MLAGFTPLAFDGPYPHWRTRSDGTSAVSSTLATRIEQTYKDCGAVDLASLGLIPHRSCWIVYVAMGNVMDQLSFFFFCKCWREVAACFNASQDSQTTPSTTCRYVDVLVLDSGGNLVDAIALAMRAALFNTRLPRVNVVASGALASSSLTNDACVRARTCARDCVFALF